MLISQSDGTNRINWSYDAGGTTVGFTLNGVPYFYLRNLQGDVTGIYDASGTIVARYEYDAWGNLLEIWDDSGYNVGELNPIRYRGYYYDSETGYYYCQSRYYNPEWRRWISSDALCDTLQGILGTNMYAYGLNDPVNFSDPSGCSASPWDGVGLALANAATICKGIEMKAKKEGIYDKESFENTLTMEIISTGSPNAFYIYGIAAFEYNGKIYTATFLSGEAFAIQHYALKEYESLYSSDRGMTAIASAVDVLITGAGFIDAFAAVANGIGVAYTAVGLIASIVDIIQTTELEYITKWINLRVNNGARGDTLLFIPLGISETTFYRVEKYAQIFIFARRQIYIEGRTKTFWTHPKNPTSDD
jgi:RHS repeat-associated protein